jgi:hypothetical protein
MITIDDIKRLKDPEKLKKHRLENLAKACADATSDEMKSMWYNKLMNLADEYNMKDYVMRKLVH